MPELLNMKERTLSFSYRCQLRRTQNPKFARLCFIIASKLLAFFKKINFLKKLALDYILSSKYEQIYFLKNSVLIYIYFFFKLDVESQAQIKRENFPFTPSLIQGRFSMIQVFRYLLDSGRPFSIICHSCSDSNRCLRSDSF